MAHAGRGALASVTTMPSRTVVSAAALKTDTGGVATELGSLLVGLAETLQYLACLSVAERGITSAQCC